MSDIVLIGYPGNPVPLSDQPVVEVLSAAEAKQRRPPRNVLQCRIELLDGTFYVVQLHVSNMFINMPKGRRY